MLGRVGAARTPAAGGGLLADQGTQPVVVQAQAVPLADVTPVLPTGVAPEPIERIDLRGLQGKWEATQSDMTNTPSMPCCALTGVERNVWTDSASGELTGFDKVNVRVCGCCWGSNYKYLAGRAGNTLCAAHHALHTPALACHRSHDVTLLPRRDCRPACPSFPHTRDHCGACMPCFTEYGWGPSRLTERHSTANGRRPSRDTNSI